MALTFKTDGIIIRAKDYKNADRLYIVYTKKFGKLILRGQGVKKINSKLAGHLEPLTLSSLFFAEARIYKKIAGAQGIDSFADIKKDLNKLNLILYCLEPFDFLIKENDPDKKLYGLLSSFLKWADKNSITMLTAKAFIVKMLIILGYELQISRNNKELSKVMKFIASASWENIQKLRLSVDIWKLLTKNVDDSLKNHLNYSLQAEKFLL